MATLTVSKLVEARPDTVWAILSDFADVSWIPIAGRVEVAGDGIGMSRSIYGGGQTPTVETLTGIEPDRMLLAYRITDNPLPVSRFEATVSVAPSESQSSIVTWDVDYDPAGETAGEAQTAKETVSAVYDMMAGWLADAATRAHPGIK